MREFHLAALAADAATRAVVEEVLAEDASIEVIERRRCDRLTAAMIQSLHADIVILDVLGSGGRGCDLIESIAAAERPAVILVAEDGAQASRAFDVGAIDYLVKPVGGARLRTALARAKNLVRNRDLNDLEARLWRLLEHALHTGMNRPAASPEWPARISLKVDGEYHIVGLRDIVWAEAQRDLVKVSVAGQVRLVRETLQQFEKQLDPTRFSRVHRSFLVNLEHVVKISAGRGGEATLWMSDGAKIPASRSSRPDLATLTGREPEQVLEFARAFQFKPDAGAAQPRP